MNCPDFDQLFGHAREGEVTPDVEAHVKSCTTCSDEVRLIRELPGALRPDLEVPDALVQRVLLDVRGPVAAPVPAVEWVPLLVSGALGALTAVAVLVGTSAVRGSNPLELALASLLLGVGAAVSQHRAHAVPSTRGGV